MKNSVNRGWRSRGWIPLAYPRSALFDDGGGNDDDGNNETRNRFFPLQRCVLQAAVRELLLIEGTLNNLNLSANRSNHVLLTPPIGGASDESTAADTKSVRVPRYKLHLDPERYELCGGGRAILYYDDEDRTALQKKRKLANNTKMKRTKSSNKMQKVSHQNNNDDGPGLITVEKSRRDCQHDDEDDDGNENDDDLICTGECLVDRIVDRAVVTCIRAGDNPCIKTESKKGADGNFLDPKETSEQTTHFCGPRKNLENNYPRPPRKVSDSDADDAIYFSSASSSSAAAAGTLQGGARDLSRFWKEPGQISSSSSLSLSGESSQKEEDIIPNMLEASIATESSLRILARCIVERLLSTFDDKSLRRFFGYKTPSLTRTKLVEVIADYLFDTSHAMFAWQQTEHEVRATSSGEEKGIIKIDDTAIKDSLFDTRALKKIGGFDDSSLLPHAISIGRLQKENISWKEFASSDRGTRMFDHHRSNESIIVVGQRRRGQRLRQRIPCAEGLSLAPSHQQPQRSRSSSFASSTDNADYGGKPSDPLIAEMPSTVDVCLRRPQDDPWGILLAREGDLCVVLRGGLTPSVKAGDLILSCSNERGEGAFSPSFNNSSVQAPASADEQASWFDRICDIFKSSNEIKLVIRRVN